MENATKALLIAAGVLFAVILIGIVYVAYGQISDYYAVKNSNLSQETLATFNNEFTAYDRNDVTGFELVSLINKAIDFNETRYREGYSKISVSVTLGSGYDNKLFEKGKPYSYDFKSSKSELATKINEMQDLEKRYSASMLTNLQSNLSNFKPSVKGRDETSYNPRGNEDRGKDIKQVLGKNYNQSQLPTKTELERYTDYLTFKRADFQCNGRVTYDSNGQINSLSFTQD